MNEAQSYASLASTHIHRRHCQMRPRRDDTIDLLSLPPARRLLLDALLQQLGLNPGDRRNAIDLAIQVGRQNLYDPIPLGTTVRSASNSTRTAIVVGTKPVGFRERWEDNHNAPGSDIALIWTVDLQSRRPGISQARLSDWIPA